MSESESDEPEIIFTLFTAILAGISFIATILRMIYFFVKTKSSPSHLIFQRPDIITHIAQFAFIGSLVFVSCAIASGSDIDVSMIIFAIAYIFYIICIEICPQYSAVRNMRNCDGCASFVRAMRATGPTLSFSVECYHFRTVQKEDNKTQEEKVVTYSNVFFIPIPYWSDDTPPLFVPTDRPFVHIKTRQVINWMHNSLHIINKIQRKTYKEYKYRDDHCAVQHSIEIPGLIPEILVKTDENAHVPFSFGFWRHILMLLGFGLPVAYSIATTAAVERLLIIKKASLEAPVVDEVFCQAYNIPYANIRPQAPVFTFSTADEQSMKYDETQGPAVTPPCYYNPYPLTVNDLQGYEQYYQNAMQYEQTAQQQQMFFNSNVTQPSAPEINSNDGQGYNDIAEDSINLLNKHTSN